jgi:hypothetical protein
MRLLFKNSIILFTLAAGIVVLALLFFVNRTQNDLSKARPDFVISAEELQKEFEENEEEAVKKYTGKIIEVSGTISSISTGEKNALTVNLKTGSDFSSVLCTFHFLSSFSDFYSGKQITIRGECSGYLMDVLLNNCVVVE